MKVLHICSGYPDTDLYRNLLKELDHKDVKQVMYVPYKTNQIKNKRMIEDAKDIDYVFSQPHNKFDKFLYHSKINKILKDIKETVDLSQINLTHAHFMFSNGGAAYRLKKETGIDYIVAVRNTDVNVFFKYGVHLRGFGVKILKEAKKIIFLSPAYKNYVIEHYIPSNLKENIANKSYIIPNGIDDFWFENSNSTKIDPHDTTKIRLVFVGELNKNKNVFTSMKAVNYLKEKGYEVRFDIIGTGPIEEELQAWITRSNNQGNIILHGYIKDKNKLIKIYREADIFLMPSFNETFGLVYIEAMTQGLPVIYSKGQGIDGYFKEGEVGFSVSPASIEDISIKIENIIKNYDQIYHNVMQVVNDFQWDKVADSYKALYEI